MSSYQSDKRIIGDYINSNQDIPFFEFNTRYYDHSFHLEKKYENFNREVFANDFIDEASFSFELGHPDLLVINDTGIIVKIRYVSLNIWRSLTDASTDVILYNFPKEVLSINNSFQFIRLNESRDYKIDQILFQYSYHSEIYIFHSKLDYNEIGIWYPISKIPNKELLPIDNIDDIQKTLNVTVYNPEMQGMLNRRWSYYSTYYLDKVNLLKIDFLWELNDISLDLSNILLEAWNNASKPFLSLDSFYYPLIQHLNNRQISSDFESTLLLTAPILPVLQVISIFMYFTIIQNQKEIFNLMVNRGMSEKYLIKLMFRKYVLSILLYLLPIVYVSYLVIKNNIISDSRLLDEIMSIVIMLIIFQTLIVSWNIIYHTRIFRLQRRRVVIVQKKYGLVLSIITFVLSIYYIFRSLIIRYVNYTKISQHADYEHIISFSLGVIFFVTFAFIIYIGNQKHILIYSRKHVLKLINKNLLVILIIISLITYNSSINYMTDDRIRDLENTVEANNGDIKLAFDNYNSPIGYSLDLTRLSNMDRINKFLPHIKFWIQLTVNEVAADIRITLFDDNYFEKYNCNSCDTLDLDNIYIESRIYDEIDLNDEINFVDLTGKKISSSSMLIPINDSIPLIYDYGGIITSINTWEGLGFNLTDQIHNHIDQDFRILIKLKSFDDYNRINFITEITNIFEIPDSTFEIYEVNKHDKYLTENLQTKSILNLMSAILFVSVGVILGYMLFYDKEYTKMSKLILKKYGLIKNSVQQVILLNAIIIGLSLTAITYGALYGHLVIGKIDLIKSIKFDNYYCFPFQLICQAVLSYFYLNNLKRSSNPK